MVDAAVARAAMMVAAGRPAEAARILGEHLVTAPDDVEATVAAAGVALVLDDLAGARRHSERALALTPESPAALAVGVRVLLALGDPRGALVLARRRVEVDPDDPGAHADLAMLLSPGDRWGLRGAPESIRRAAAMAPDDPAVAMAGAASLRLRGSAKRAAPIYRRLLREDPERLELRLALAETDAERGANVLAVRRLFAIARETGGSDEIRARIALASSSVLTRVTLIGAALCLPLAFFGQGAAGWRAAVAVALSALVLVVGGFALARLGRDAVQIGRYLGRAEPRIALSAMLAALAVPLVWLSAATPDPLDRVLGWCGLGSLVLGLAAVGTIELEQSARSFVARQRRRRAAGESAPIVRPILGTVLFSAVVVAFFVWRELR